jgi:acetyl-CoA carboxylase biotin carboxylase subunit
VTSPFRRLLVANRGEIAVRVLRTAREMGIETVAVYSDADRSALHVRRADRAVRIGPPPPRESYLSIDAILAAAKESGAQAVHPGYGFLSENEDFAQACADAGLVFVGPPPAAIALMGDKVAARRAATQAGVPLVPGADQVGELHELRAMAQRIGYPVMLKAAAGGGGKGIRIVESEKALAEAARLARAEAANAFGDDRVYLEKFLVRPRHVEIQVLADRDGAVAHYGERECSVQRRHQKLIEESPSPAIDARTRAAMGEAACKLAAAVGYEGAGTVEFLWSEGEFYFLEMNTRLQVEHPITELRYGVDLVREQIRIAAGEPLGKVPEPRGHAIEVRINAEDPDTMLPSLGAITRLNLPSGPGVRVDAALYRGLEVTPYYDSLLAKLIVHADHRDAALARMERALRETRIVGVETVVPLALALVRGAELRSGVYDTGIVGRHVKATDEERLELAAIAAAAYRFLGAEQHAASGAAATRAQAISPWKLAGRLDVLRGQR